MATQVKIYQKIFQNAWNQSLRIQVLIVGVIVLNNKGLVHGVDAKACVVPKNLVGRIQAMDATELLVVKRSMNVP